MNINLLALSYIEVPEIDLAIAKQKLYVNPLAKHVKKKPIKLAPYLEGVIMTEIDKLKEVRFIKEVEYPD